MIPAVFADGKNPTEFLDSVAVNLEIHCAEFA
jgi:hypothetical protein